MSKDETVSCGTCGIKFENEEQYERHIFKFNGNRWCGTRLIRMIESDKQLSLDIDQRLWKYKEWKYKEFKP